MTISEMIELNDLTPLPYSGRGMFGKECLSFTVPDYFTLYQAIAELAFTASEDDEDRDTLRRAIGQLRTEHAGRSIIAYFPTVSWHPED